MDKVTPVSIDVCKLLLLHHKPIHFEEKDGDEILVNLIKKGKVLYISLFCDAKWEGINFDILITQCTVIMLYMFKIKDVKHVGRLQ